MSIDKSEFNSSALEKFERYQKLCIGHEKEMKEQKSLIERLKGEIIMCTGTEEHLRVQLNHAQKRALTLQKQLNQLEFICEEHRKQKDTINTMENKLAVLSKMVSEEKKKLEDKIKTVTYDLKCSEEIKHLQSAIKVKEDAFFLVQMEHETKLNEKNLTINQLNNELAQVKDDIQTFKLERDAIKNEFEGFKIYHNQQKRQYEHTIHQYEMERSAMLGDFIESSPVQKNRVHWGTTTSITFNSSDPAGLQDNHVSSQSNEETHATSVLETFHSKDKRPKKQQPRFQPKIPSKNGNMKKALSVEKINTQEFGEKKKKLYSKEDSNDVLY